MVTLKCKVCVAGYLKTVGMPMRAFKIRSSAILFVNISKHKI